MSDSTDELMYLDDDYKATDDDFSNPSSELNHDVSLMSVSPVLDFSLPLDEILLSINRTICKRLNGVESSVDALDHFCFVLDEKVEKLSEAIRKRNAVFTSTPQTEEPKPSNIASENSSSEVINTSESERISIPLNCEEDFPDGTWLGDETNPTMRVRCQISPADLLHVHATCHTAEKMALTLMDCLFERETQACSNISGNGKHKKEQLDPLKIYGIRCHLVHKFGIKDKDWQRIKQNMDSKCRTAFRRKQNGMPLHRFREQMSCSSQFSVLKSPPSSIVELSSVEKTEDQQNPNAPPISHVLTLQQGTITLASQTDFMAMVNGAQVIQTEEGEIQILHATAEQLAEMEQSHQVHILSESQVLLPDTITHHVGYYKGDETKELDKTDSEKRLQQE